MVIYTDNLARQKHLITEKDDKRDKTLRSWALCYNNTCLHRISLRTAQDPAQGASSECTLGDLGGGLQWI